MLHALGEELFMGSRSLSRCDAGGRQLCTVIISDEDTVSTTGEVAEEFRTQSVDTACHLGAACHTDSGDALGMAAHWSGPFPYCSQTVMSLPVRCSIIACVFSGSNGSGSGWSISARHRASLPARKRLDMSIADRP